VDSAGEKQVRETLAGEHFGVLATLAQGRLHTATIHFAETDDLELVHAIRPATLKARLAGDNPRVAFQVDNRGVLLQSRERFLRISFEGTLRALDRDHPEYETYRRAFTSKLPVGERILTHEDVTLYVLRPSIIRVAAGAAPAEDVTVTYLEDDADADPAGVAEPDNGRVYSLPAEDQSRGVSLTRPHAAPGGVGLDNPAPTAGQDSGTASAWEQNRLPLPERAGDEPPPDRA
jgi:nitroimidazol reductase NimA-like FMN-containing flavoprotein (pyridoxamine 5'-phosphate oxidase superfamily)